MNILIMMIAMSLAGSSIAVTRSLTGTMPVFLANELILAIAWVALLPFGMGHLHRLLRNRGWKTMWKVLRWPILQALFGMALFRVLTFFGLRHVSAIDGGLLTATTPAVMAVMAYVFLGEIPHSRRWMGIGLAVSGVAALNWQSGAASGAMTGIVLMLLATACESLLTIFRRMEKAPIPAAVNAFYIVTFSMLFLAPAAVVENEWSMMTRLNSGQWYGCIYLGLPATAVAYLCWGYAAPRMDANMTGIVTAMMPLSATVISIVWLKEALVLRHGVGGALILASILLNVRKKTITARRPAPQE
jgi:drug/metabolite transporter (DMT)-like permease